MAGEFSVSNNGCFIAQTLRNAWGGGTAELEVLNFDNKTGEIGDRIFTDTSSAVFGIEFSENATKLYITSNDEAPIYQYNLGAGSTADIIDSKIAVSPFVFAAFKIRIAPDKKIYFTSYSSAISNIQLSVINNPNELGLLSNINMTAFPSLGSVNMDLPNNYNLTYTDPFCNDTARTVPADTTINCQVFFPNAFSPNNDNRNDKFTAINLTNIEILKISIYDRWGNEVYSNNSNNFDWKGDYKGIPLPVGVYFYYCNYLCKKNNTQIMAKGDIVLVR